MTTAANTSSSSISINIFYGDKVVGGTKITSPLTISGSASRGNASDAYAVEALVKNSSGIVVDTIWLTGFKAIKNGCADGIDDLERRGDRSADAGDSRHGGYGRCQLDQPAPLTQ